MRLAIVLAVIGRSSALAAAEPARTPAPAPIALPHLRVPALTIERIAAAPVRVAPPRVPPAVEPESSLEVIVTRASAFVARVSGFQGRLGGYFDLENLTSSQPAAPRVIVVGVRFGAKPDPEISSR